MAFELLEVVDEHLGELVGLLGPLCGIGVGVAGVEDLGIHAGKLGGDGEIEDGELLCGSGEDGAVKDGIDDTTGITDGDTLACAVPAGVDEISLGTALFHTLHEFLGILGGVERKERCAETCRECGGRLGDAALCAGELGGEAGEEVVLGLLGGED